jgi:hypothetical protein
MPSCATVPASAASSNARQTSSVAASDGSGECSTSESIRSVRRFASERAIDWRACTVVKAR